MIKLDWVQDREALENGQEVSAVVTIDNKPTMIRVRKDKDSIIKKVIKSGSINAIKAVYLQGCSNDCQQLKKDKSKAIMDAHGGVIDHECKYTENGVEHLRIVKVRYTYVESRGLPYNDPRAYDNNIIDDDATARLEGEYSL